MIIYLQSVVYRGSKHDKGGGGAAISSTHATVVNPLSLVPDGVHEHTQDHTEATPLLPPLGPPPSHPYAGLQARGHDGGGGGGGVDAGKTGHGGGGGGGGRGDGTVLDPAMEWVRVAAHVRYGKTGQVVQVVAIEPPMPGDADVFLSIRLADGTLRETCGKCTTPLLLLLESHAASRCRETAPPMSAA